MTTNAATQNKPLWLAMEEKILGLSSQDLSEDNRERTIQKLAQDLDNEGHTVSSNGGNMLRLRWALEAREKVGRPLMQDFNDALAALKLEDVTDPWLTAMKLMGEVGENWPELQDSERRPDVLRIMQKTRLDLLIKKAKELSGDEGIRFLIGEEVDPAVITEALGITQEQFGQVKARVEAEQAERTRVAQLLEKVNDKSEDEKIKHLMTNNVAQELIIEMAGVDQSAIDSVNKAMEAELAEKKRLEEEAAAKKATEAAGPPLEEIPPDDLLGYIEEIRDILEFSDVEKEIRGMCEQSSIPKCLVDIAVSQPEKLDELEKKAEG
jgi:hypothetical protein